MSIICKKCDSEEISKNGFVLGKQRYLCKVCGMNFTEGDRREKHDKKVIRAAIDLYIEGNGFRRISRLLKKTLNVNICYQLIIHWVKGEERRLREWRPKKKKKTTSHCWKWTNCSLI